MKNQKLVVGIVAHVDAGKTTLAESMLYSTGRIRQFGRVDHKNTFLDTDEMERARGITIFSKQARLPIGEFDVTLLDTPGHIDFSAEMERTLQVLDYAILVISASDGVQSHTQTLWRLLQRYQIPTFLFVNKMDLAGSDREAIMKEMKTRLSDGCIDFSTDRDFSVWRENLAMCDERLLEEYLNGVDVRIEQIRELILKRKLFPCYFGSALKSEGIEEFITDVAKCMKCKEYPEEFGARVFKISRDDQGNRMTHLKITGGNLKVKSLLTNQVDQSEEKADQIRIYSGTKYELVENASAGSICAVTGLMRTLPGQGMGREQGEQLPILEPVLNYSLILPPGCDAIPFLEKIRQLEEEDPQLHIVWSTQHKQIWVQLMGEVQLETLQMIIKSRFGVVVEFGEGAILYKETILKPVIGVGHFEPLRHYAEVHLLLEPDEAGSGITFSTNCSEDKLERNWQKQILTHLKEKEHPGVLIGSPITDMRVTLVAGAAHLKHTEGGDFRQAAFRALRQGLKKTKSRLLEPVYEFRLEIPQESVGRAMSDITRMNGEVGLPELLEEGVVLCGTAPVVTMRGYQREVISYTKGKGRLFCELKGYAPCHNEEEVIDQLGYDSEADPEYPTGSVFCEHGAGTVVPWEQVENRMHVEYACSKSLYLIPAENRNPQDSREIKIEKEVRPTYDKRGSSDPVSWNESRELEAIFERTFGPIRQRTNPNIGGLGYEKLEEKKESISVPTESTLLKTNKPKQKEYLLVDGYNIIFAWEELKSLAERNLDAARAKLMDLLCNYQGFKQCILILVFDAYKVKGNVGEQQEYHNITVVYTKEAQTADAYIERLTSEIGKKHRVVVATSDGMEQMIILGHGATRLSAQGLKEELLHTSEQIREEYLNIRTGGKQYLGDHMGEEMLQSLKIEKSNP